MIRGLESVSNACTELQSCTKPWPRKQHGHGGSMVKGVEQRDAQFLKPKLSRIRSRSISYANTLLIWAVQLAVKVRIERDCCTKGGVGKSRPVWERKQEEKRGGKNFRWPVALRMNSPE